MSPRDLVSPPAEPGTRNKRDSLKEAWLLLKALGFRGLRECAHLSTRACRGPPAVVSEPCAAGDVARVISNEGFTKYMHSSCGSGHDGGACAPRGSPRPYSSRCLRASPTATSSATPRPPSSTPRQVRPARYRSAKDELSLLDRVL